MKKNWKESEYSEEEKTDNKDESMAVFRQGLVAGMMLMLAVFVFGWTILTAIHQGKLKKQSQKQEASSEVQFEYKIKSLKQQIEKYYIDDYEEKNLQEGMYAGLVYGLGDPYSAYFTEEEFSKISEETSGVYKGIGVVMSKDKDTGRVKIVSIYEDSPGEKAGLKPGDFICEINGQDITEMDLTSVSAMIRGADQDEVQLKIFRTKTGYLELDIIREEIEIKTVASKMLDDHVGYLVISEFETATSSQFKKELEQLKKDGMQSLIIDLRDNPGGVVVSACEIADLLLPEGLIVYTEDKNGEKKEVHSDAACLGMPMAVLINENSASSSEILAGAIKDYHAGTLVGTTSFGKGIVQTIFKLSDHSAIKLTTAKYYTPSGNNIHGIGIEPDIEIEYDTTSILEKKHPTWKDDSQLKKAYEYLKKEMDNDKTKK